MIADIHDDAVAGRAHGDGARGLVLEPVAARIEDAPRGTGTHRGFHGIHGGQTVGGCVTTQGDPPKQRAQPVAACYRRIRLHEETVGHRHLRRALLRGLRRGLRHRLLRERGWRRDG